MDMQQYLWAFHIGLIVGAPVCLVVGLGFALTTTFSALHYTFPKLVGWLLGIPFALSSGVPVAQYLVPGWWPEVGVPFCSGYGWVAIWGLISMLGHRDGWLANGLRKIFRGFRGRSGGGGSGTPGATPIRLKALSGGR